MAHRIFDSNKLIGQLRKIRPHSTPADADRLARELIDIYDTNAIVSPVEIEVLAGVRNPQELALTERFLDHFEVIDARKIPREDWEGAGRLAKRVVAYDREVPRRRRSRAREPMPNTPARDLGDCLITAIARRLRREIITDDGGIPRQAGRAGPA